MILGSPTLRQREIHDIAFANTKSNISMRYNEIIFFRLTYVHVTNILRNDKLVQVYAFFVFQYTMSHY